MLSKQAFGSPLRETYAAQSNVDTIGTCSAPAPRAAVTKTVQPKETMKTLAKKADSLAAWLGISAAVGGLQKQADVGSGYQPPKAPSISQRTPSERRAPGQFNPGHGALGGTPPERLIPGQFNPGHGALGGRPKTLDAIYITRSGEQTRLTPEQHLKQLLMSEQQLRQLFDSVSNPSGARAR